MKDAAAEEMDFWKDIWDLSVSRKVASVFLVSSTIVPPFTARRWAPRRADATIESRKNCVVVVAFRGTKVVLAESKYAKSGVSS